MIALLLAVAQAVSPPPPEEEIVILGRRLRRVEVDITLTRKGEVKKCRVKKGVGDPVFDRFWCDAAHACSDSGQTSAEAMKNCLRTREREFLAALSTRYPGSATPPATGK
ncbi:hypothetical protein [Sphingomonas sp.]|uniref:hypothetical protein n=1 Tax=Sphingomonas sp. TaxID=28214 RepID=UPI002EDB063D